MPLSNETTVLVMHCADLVEQLSQRGIKIPKDLASDVAGLRRTDIGADQHQGVDVDLEVHQAKELTDKFVDELIARRVQDKVAVDARPFALSEVRDAIGRRVLRNIRAAAPALLDALADDFNTAAGTFTEAIGRLPAGWTDPAVLVDAGAETVEAFATARNAKRALDHLADIRDFCARRLGIRAPGNEAVEEGSRYCSVRNTGSARRVFALHPATNPLGRWAEIITTNGVEDLRWRTIAEHRAYIAQLPAVEDSYERAVVNGFTTTQFVEA